MNLPQRKALRFKMNADELFNDNMKKFNRIVIDLENIDVGIKDEDQRALILNSLPKLLSIFMLYLKIQK